MCTKGLTNIIEEWLCEFYCDHAIRELCVEDASILIQRLDCLNYERILNECLEKMPDFDEHALVVKAE